MRIALFTETYLPYINGVVTHVKLLREGLEKLGHTVLVVTSDPNTHHHYIEDGVLHCPAVKLKKIYGYGLASPYSHTRTKLLEEFHPDIIHIQTEFTMGLFGLFCARQLKKPVVITLLALSVLSVLVTPYTPMYKVRFAQTSFAEFNQSEIDKQLEDMGYDPGSLSGEDILTDPEVHQVYEDYLKLAQN